MQRLFFIAKGSKLCLPMLNAITEDVFDDVFKCSKYWGPGLARDASLKSLVPFVCQFPPCRSLPPQRVLQGGCAPAGLVSGARPGAGPSTQVSPLVTVTLSADKRSRGSTPRGDGPSPHGACRPLVLVVVGSRCCVCCRGGSLSPPLFCHLWGAGESWCLLSRSRWRNLGPPDLGPSR